MLNPLATLAPELQADLDNVSRIGAVPTILEVVCRSTGMGFAAIARVTEDKWLACSVLDEIDFGLKPGGELKLETTICHEIRHSREPVVIDNVAEDATWCKHATPKLYGFQSYISMPIILSDGSFFGTLCAIDPRPARVKTVETIGMFRLFAELIARHLDGNRKLAATELLFRVVASQRDIAEADAVMHASAEAAGTFLKAERAGFFEMHGDTLGFHAGWTAGRFPLLAGAVPCSTIRRGHLKELRAGKTLWVKNARTDPLTPGAALGGFRTMSMLGIPIIRAGALRAGFYITHAAPYVWSDDYIRLARDFGEQTWDSVERARIEAARRATEERLNLALEAGGGVGTWEWDVPNDRVICNAQFARLFSIEPSRALEGVPISGFLASIHEDDRESVSRKIQQTLNTGGEYTEEYRVEPQRVGVRWILARGRCHLNGQGDAARFSGVVFDVTERHKRERKMFETAKLESLGVMAGGVAHDFNNLLTGILGNASLLAEMVSDVHRPFAEQIVNASHRASHLTRQMLAYSGRGRFELAQLNLSQQVREILPLIEPSLRSATVTLNLDDSVPSIRADPGQMQQVVMNLIINAAEAITGYRGTVSISTGVEEIDEAYIERVSANEWIRPGSYVWMEVRDTGSGMSKETKAKIFDPFFTTKFTGRGLGLAAVSGIVRGHKGAVNVESAPGRGTSFKVMFPVSPKASRTEGAKRPAR